MTQNKALIAREEWPLLGFAVAFFISAGLSLINIDPELFGAGVKYWFRPLVFFYLMFVVLPYNIISSKKILFRLFRVMFWVGMFVSVIGLYSLIQQSGTGVLRAIPVPIFGLSLLGTNHNQLAETLVVIFPIAMILFWYAKTEDAKYLYGIGAFIIGLVNLLTLSRAGWITLALEIGLIAFFVYRERVTSFLKSYGFYLIILALIPAAFLMYQLLTSGVASSSNTNRLDLIELSFTFFRAHPILGSGIGIFYPTVSGIRWYIIEYGSGLDAHGFVFKVIAEQGILGLVTFSALLLAVLYTIGKKLYQSWGQTHALILLGAFLSAGGAMLFQFFNTDYYTAPMWFPIGVALAATKLRGIMKSNS